MPLLFHHYHTRKKNTTWQTKFRNLVILNKLYCLVKQKLYRLEYSILCPGFQIQVLQFMKSGKFLRVIFKTFGICCPQEIQVLHLNSYSKLLCGHVHT